MTTGAVLAFDLGGTRLKAGLVSSDDDVERMEVAELGAATGDEAVDVVVRTGTALLEDGEVVAGVGLCVPGLVDDDGRIVDLPGKFPGIVGIDLRARLRAALGAEAVVVNDAIAYGIGEATAGAGAGHERVVVVTIGTGFGVACIERGRPLGRGPLGGGMMGGFIPIGEDSPGTDTAGGRGTIEAHCRAERIVTEAGGGYTEIREVYAGYARGEDAARAGVERYRQHLARALAALANAHAPETIVVGGGPAGADAPIFEGLEGAVNERLWEAYRVRVAPAALGDAAALVGLARLGRSTS